MQHKVCVSKIEKITKIIHVCVVSKCEKYLCHLKIMPTVCKPSMTIDVILTSRKCQFLISTLIQRRNYIEKALIQSSHLA